MRTPPPLRTALLVALASLALSAEAHAVAIESFNVDGSGSTYLVSGGGGSGDDFWGLQSIGNSFGFSGQEGADFFGGRDLNSPFSGGVNPLTVEIPASGAVPLAPGPQHQLQILLAANFGGMWDAGQDFLRIIAIDGDTSAETVLDAFLPNGAGNLESTTFAGLILDTTFQDVTYDVPISIANLELRIEAWTTGDLEFLGFDSIRVIPEPGSGLLLGLGLTALAAGRRRA